MVSSGKVYLGFEHINTERDLPAWEITVIDVNDNAVLKTSSKGTDLTLKSKEIDLAKGTYYVKVEASDYTSAYNDTDYKLSINGAESWNIMFPLKS
ncbi:MAG: hypothetical protein BWY74_01714 [Firmicutes bacterium ADurb.Bin419]|nr:MAG: hypothetical protein BWY74_01714 [Firmicutes bacterium ADurb.Bin419]